MMAAELDTNTTVETDDTGAKTLARTFKAYINVCKKRRRDLIQEMQTSVDMRRGKQSEADSDETRLSIAVDWSQTKAKISQLFSQVPKVIATAERQEYKPAAAPWEKRLNMRITKGGVSPAFNEVMPDVVNAAGFGAVIVTYEAKTEVVQVPKQAPALLSGWQKMQSMLGLSAEPEMEDQERVVDRKFSIDRISPADLLWDVEFKRSDFNRSGWIGHSGQMPWVMAQPAFGLEEDEKDTYCGNTKDSQDKITPNDDTDTSVLMADMVSYDEIFYWRYLYHPEEKYFSAIQRMVFIPGKEEPVIDEPWTGQEFDPEVPGGYVGSCIFPIQVLTLNYLSDETMPPSDSAIARPQVKELIRSRQQIIDQRDHSKPIRWYDVNRIDSDIQTLLMDGQWQGFIPTQGDGSRAIGEVARSNYPPEDFRFDAVIRGDLMESWSIGPNQMGSMSPGERSAAEAKITQGNFSTRIGQERALTVAFFLNIAQVMGGLVALYDDFELPLVSEEDAQRLQMWDRKRIPHELAFSIRGDSTILLDAEQRIERLMRFINIAGKSGYVNPQSIIEELAALSGLDPALVVQAPQQKGPEQPNMSYRFSGDDMMNPVAVGVMVKNKQAPSPQDLMDAKRLIAAAGELAPHPVEPEAPMPPGGPASAMADDRPEWQSVDRINSRRDASQE